jgi:hypothetical protein
VIPHEEINGIPLSLISANFPKHEQIPLEQQLYIRTKNQTNLNRKIASASSLPHQPSNKSLFSRQTKFCCWHQMLIGGEVYFFIVG